MIKYVKGNLLESNAEALVNTVNTVGVMGKGIALQFKNQYPGNYKIYQRECKANRVQIGRMLVTNESTLLKGTKTIINFPTKTDWRKPSEYEYIKQGLSELKQVLITNRIKSVAVPPLGAGNGKLDWVEVKKLIEFYLSTVDCEVLVYEPNSQIEEVMRKERVKLTPARAMLLAVLYELVRNEEFISEFAAEKVSYFLCRFGGKENFKLDFQPNFYGPYSGNVRHVLHYLNGSYLTGYSAKDTKPFQEIWPVMDGEKEIEEYLNASENARYNEIVQKTKQFLAGFYSSFALELLSTVDFIMQNQHATTPEEVKSQLETWNNRKRTMFAKDSFIHLAYNHLTSFKSMMVE
ncbi:MAG: macro domain-containing protein [Parabacteroides sp.]